MSNTHDHIVQDTEPVLRKKAKPIPNSEIASPKIQHLIAQMQELLAREDNGVGLAAPQVGVSLRLFIVSGKALMPERDAKSSENNDEKTTAIPPDMVCINPELVRASRAKKEMSEGCLSVRGLYGSVVRHEKATIRALDQNGEPFIRHASGLLSQIFQHEIDHLDGVLYTDKAVSLDQDAESKKKGAPLAGQKRKKIPAKPPKKK